MTAGSTANNDRSPPSLDGAAAFVSALIVASASILISVAIANDDRRQVSTAIASETVSLRSELEGFLNSRISALTRMAKRWEQRGHTPEAEWFADARQLKADFPDFQAIEWVDPGFVVRWIEPLAGNEQVLNMDSAFEKRRLQALRAAKERRDPTVTRAIDLVQGGKGFLVYVPIFADDDFHGFIMGVFRIRPLLDGLLWIRDPHGYSTAIYDEGEEIYTFADEGRLHEDEWAHEVDVDFYGVRWRARVWPTPDQLTDLASGLSRATLTFGLVLACLLAITVQLAQSNRHRAKALELAGMELGRSHDDLEERVEERTREISRINHRLTVELTDHKAARAKLARTSASLEKRTQELEVANRELKAFCYSVSHDLRGPLRSLDGFSLLLEEKMEDQEDAETRDIITRIRGASQRMGRLIDELLTLSRLSRGELRYEPGIDLSEIAAGIAEELRAGSPNRLADFAIAPKVVATGDRALLHDVLYNLMQNAWKFTRTQERAQIGFGLESENGTRQYFVRDNGVGFDPAHADNLFGLFQRLHKADEFEGTGIGLATVERIVARHGGRVWADSHPDAGATFYFTLPTNNEESS